MYGKFVGTYLGIGQEKDEDNDIKVETSGFYGTRLEKTLRKNDEVLLNIEALKTFVLVGMTYEIHGINRILCYNVKNPILVDVLEARYIIKQ